MAAMYFAPGISPVAILSAARLASAPLAVCALRVRPGEKMVRLIPAGRFEAPLGAMKGDGPWRLSAEGAAMIIAENASRSTDILLDYEHQSELAADNGLPVLASGWIDPRSLEFRGDGEEPGLYGAVTWTAKAAAAIGADEYRYLSPVFFYTADGGEVIGLKSVALTNQPGIDEPMKAALRARLSVSARGGRASASTEEKPEVELKQLLEALGLPETTSEADAIAGVAALKARADVVTEVRNVLGVGADGSVSDAIAVLKTKASAQSPDLSQYVPKAVFEETRAQLATLKSSGDSVQLDALIEEGLADGRIAGKATADYLRGQGLAALKAHLDDTPSIAALKVTQTKGKAPKAGEGDGELSAEEMAVCRQMGLDPKAYKEAN